MSDLVERLNAEADEWADQDEEPVPLLREAAHALSPAGRIAWLEALSELSPAPDLLTAGFDGIGLMTRGRYHTLLCSPPEVQAAVCALCDAKLEAKRHD